MTRICHDTYKYLRVLQIGLILGLLLAVALPVQAGDPFGFSGNWNYRETGGDIESMSQFSHSYTLNYNKELSQFMNLSGSLRYNENLPSEGAATDSINPSLSVDTRNDLFFLGLSASQNKINREGSLSTTDTSWGGTFVTLKEQWPTLRTFFNHSNHYDDGDPRQLDTESTNFSNSIEYELADFSMLYDYSNAISDNMINGASTENIEHLAQLKYSRSFIGNMLTLTASQQYRENQTTTKTPTGFGGEFLLPVTILTGSSDPDDTPANGVLTNNQDLVDHDVASPAGVNITTSPVQQNMAVQVNRQPVSRLRVLLDQQLSTTLQGLLSWQVWVSDDGVGWAQVAIIPAVYQVEDNRSVVVLDLPNASNSRYLKAVSHISIVSANSVFVTELEAGEIRTSTESRVSIRTNVISHQTEFGLSYRPSEQRQVNYNVRRVKNEQDRGADNEQLNQSLNVSFFPVERLNVSLGVNENSDKVDGSEDRNIRSYAASMNAELLKTLNMSLGYTRTEIDNNDGLDTNSDTINALFNAIIYPDLTASLTNSWSHSQNQAGGEITTMGATLNTTARVSPKLDANLNASYVENITDGPTSASDISDNSTRYGLSANYRPSDILQLSGSFNRDEDAGQNGLAGNATFLATRNLQALFGFAYEFGETKNQFYNTTLSWLLTQELSWQTTGNMVSSEGGDSWALSSTVNARF